MTPWRPASALVGLAILGTALSGCPSPVDPVPHILEAPPVDTARVALRDALGWPVQRSVLADLDADGGDERLVLASTREGEARWALWAVELAPDSARTLLYGAAVPEGQVDVAVEQPSIGEAPDILVLERAPTQIRVMEVRYHAPGDARLVSTAHHQPRLWLTGPDSDFATDAEAGTD